MKTNFDLLTNRRDSDSIKWNLYDEDVLPLWVADTDFLSPSPVIKALKNRTDHEMFGYTKTQETTKEAIREWLLTRHDWEITLEDIILLPGVVQGFNFAAKAFTNPGDSVLFQTPAYHPFFHVAGYSNLIQITSPLTRINDNTYVVSHDDFISSISPRTRLFLLCNPQNPTGRVFTKEELELMSQVCLDHKIIICSDEIHGDLIFSGSKHIPISTISEAISDITITLISPSKTFNLAGLNCSAAIITNPSLREQLIQSMSGFAGSVNLLGETALRSAYQFGGDWLDLLLPYLEANRNLLFDYVTTQLPGIQVNKPEGTYLCWLDCSE
ncbi:PatB family C-S lyase, partial [Candidatus Pacearchaeota archaeon]|nr:PatB family C-S lyase [Candidatus Pacearchaeota archaeon]